MAAAFLFGIARACNSIGPDTVPRDRSDAQRQSATGGSGGRCRIPT